MEDSVIASTPVDGGSIGEKLALFAADIKISHTLFALPFAMLSAFLAARGMPAPGILALILGCMVTARTVAMGANRLLDARLDAMNPRTVRRAIPSGALGRGFYWGTILLCAAGFFACAFGFYALYGNVWPIIFAAPVLAYISAYPFMKRFTRFCHYYLGGALALAPVCAWIAVRGDMRLAPILMAAAVLTWTAGFDILYACQDYESDLTTGVFSIPAKLGIARALMLARATHAACFTFLILLGRSSPNLGVIYFSGVGLAGLLLIIEHSLVKPNDLSKVNLAFFTINGMFSVLLGALGILDIFF